MRTANPAARNSGQLSRLARLSVRDPWLPPVIRRCSRSPRGFGGMAKNSSRTGNPVSSDLPRAKYRAVSGKEISARAASRPIARLVNPGIAFGSITTTGTRFTSAAITAGPATYPPMLKTADAR